MLNASQLSSHRLKHGYYIVDGKTYNNKFLALTNRSTSSDMRFYFNDDAYSAVNWSVEPSEDLYELYRQRAQQLRDKYDNLVLYYSGGIDSITILNTFLANNIKLDGVVMYGTWKLDQKYQQNNLDVVEQNRVGIPLIKALEQKYNTKINLYLLDTTDMYKNFKSDDFVYNVNTFLGPRMYCHNFYWQDPWMQSWLMKGNTAFIRGIDKPRVLVEDNHWCLGFLDSQIIDSSPAGMYDKSNDHAITEYFFWTPDFTPLIVKQAHTVIKYFEQHLPAHLFPKLCTKTASFDQGTYFKYVDPLIYGKYTPQKPGEEKPYFSLPKSIAPSLVQKDLWFYQTGNSEMKQEFDVWKAGVNRLQSTINPAYLNSSNGRNKDQPYDTWIQKIFNEFNLSGIEVPDLSQPHILWGTVGTWSKFYQIKPYTPSTSINP